MSGAKTKCQQGWDPSRGQWRSSDWPAEFTSLPLLDRRLHFLVASKVLWPFLLSGKLAGVCSIHSHSRSFLFLQSHLPWVPPGKFLSVLRTQLSRHGPWDNLGLFPSLQVFHLSHVFLPATCWNSHRSRAQGNRCSSVCSPLCSSTLESCGSMGNTWEAFFFFRGIEKLSSRQERKLWRL